jgi:hypothetical protein
VGEEALFREARRMRRRRRGRVVLILNPLTYFAVSPNGTIYADDIPGDEGFEAHQQLLSVSDRHIRLLWQEHDARPR